MEGKRLKRSGTPSGIRESLKKATTEMMVLYLLQEKPMYTYEMMAAIEARSNGAITFNTLYQSIYRLQDHQYIRESDKVVSPDNRVRIYFAITESGKAYLESLIQEYLSFTGNLDRILGLKREEQSK
jgi:PadR family transcriptional regulator PadR